MFGCSMVETVLCQLELGYYLLGLGLEGCSWFSVQVVRGTICKSLGYVGGSGAWSSTTVVLSASTGSTIFSEDRVVTPLDTAITLSNSTG